MVKVLLVTGLLGCFSISPQTGGVGAPPRESQLIVNKSFHIAGIPGFQRHARLDVVLTDAQIIFNKRKGRQEFKVPFSRIEKVVLFSGHRRYAKTAIATAAASYGIGSLLMIKKRMVDTLVVDYRNERGGLMGIAVQLPAGQGESCRQWLDAVGVKVEEPELEK